MSALRMRARELAENPDARFPDEEAEEPENDPDGPARKMMEYLEEHREQLGSQHYVELANISMAFAKTERRSVRMRKKLIEYDGSDCSALVPSDDGPQIEEDDYVNEPIDDDSYSDSESGDEVAASVGSTVTSQGGDELPDVVKSANQAALDPSGYFMKYRGTYYAVPKQNIKRNYKRPATVATADEMVRRTKRGERAMAWEFEAICPASVVIVEMVARNSSGGEKDFFWCVPMKLEHATDLSRDDSKILHVLPETTVLRLVRTLEADPEMSRSGLIEVYKPKWVKECNQYSSGNRFKRTLPIPGPSTQIHTRYPVEHGNYWPRLRHAKRIRSATDHRYRIERRAANAAPEVAPPSADEEEPAERPARRQRTHRRPVLDDSD